MGWPNFSQYNAALHNPRMGLIPAELKDAIVSRNGYGSPDPLSGGFAYLYQLTLSAGIQKALRVFIQEDSNRDLRLPQVLRTLMTHREKKPYLGSVLLDTAWIHLCVATTAGNVPGVLMDWSRGQPLGEWLRKHRGSTDVILDLRERFFYMIEQLEAEGIAHGDLQAGNILIRDNLQPVLVDYDGVSFFNEKLPALLEGGHPNFQHPLRTGVLPATHLDRFSAITIDLGLLAWALLSEESWFEPLVSDSDRLYFSGRDFRSLEASESMTRLRQFPVFTAAAAYFIDICRGSPQDVPTLREFRDRVFPEKITASTRSDVTGVGSTAPGSQIFTGSYGKLEVAYIPAFPLYSVLDVTGLLKKVGEVVEVVGEVLEVHEGYTKYGDPYVFVNFMDWREPEIFHLVAWSEDLDVLENYPDVDWCGKWMQITGLLEEYNFVRTSRRGKKNQVRLSIRLRRNDQFRFLTREEGIGRLLSKPQHPLPFYRGGSGGEGFVPAKITHALEPFTSVEPGSGGGRAAKPTRALEPSNRELLQRLETTSSNSLKNSQLPTTTPPFQSSKPKQSSSPYDPGSNLGTVFFLILFWIGLTFLFFTIFGQR